MKVTYIGHATFLIEIDGEYILTDPNFSRKIFFVKRLKEPGIRPEDLPPLKAILVTHAHYDHLDLFSYKYFALDVPIVVPQGLGKFIQKFLKNPVIELPLWGEHLLGGLKIYSVPVKHQGFRLSGLTLRGTTGYLLEKEGKTILFPGDTAYGDHFKKISNLHSIDVALLPIGAYEPRWFMKNRHMSPADALKAFHDLKAKTMIPYHWGVFRISAEQPEAPLQTLQTLLQEHPDLNVKVLEAGEKFGF